MRRPAYAFLGSLSLATAALWAWIDDEPAATGDPPVLLDPAINT